MKIYIVFEGRLIEWADLLIALATYQDAVSNLTDAQCNYQIKNAKYLLTINK